MSTDRRIERIDESHFCKQPTLQVMLDTFTAHKISQLSFVPEMQYVF